MSFALHPRLEADTVFVADWPLSRLLLMNDVRYPWLILVPRREGAVEIADLPQPDQSALMEEIVRVQNILRDLPGVQKLNVGALGNLVPQLHVHVIGRRPGDPAWPGPVWGHSPAEPYGEVQCQALIARVMSR